MTRLSAVLAAVGALLPTLVAQAQHANPDDPKHARSSPPVEASAPSAAPATPAATEPPAGILPIPDYSGDLLDRHALTGDWGGARTDLANKGIQLDLRWLQYLQGVASGGRDNDTEYGGKGDYLLNLDLMRMGVLPGALVKFRAESRYGRSVNGIAGPILPVNTQALFPLTDELDHDVPFTISDLAFTQVFSEQFAVFLGKIDTLDGDPNEFASGRGASQFMNANFVFNAALSLRLPYSTLGAGFAWKPVKGVSLASTIMNTADSSTTTGFEDFGSGTTWVTEADFQYRLADLPGGMNVGALYSFDQEFAKLNSRLVLQPGQTLSVQTADDTWAVYWSGWQYLLVDDPSDAPIDLTNGAPDHRGLGLFARVGVADQETNPIKLAVSAGVGGRGPIPTRDDDTFGLGYFYTSLQTARLQNSPIRDQAQGFEAFYNIAITPASHLTLDVQVAKPATSALDTAVILGARLEIAF